MYLSIDVGGTKTLVAKFSEDGQKQNQLRFETPFFYPDFISELGKSIKEVSINDSPTSCAIAMPGNIDRDNGVVLSFGNLPWENVAVVNDLSSFVDCPIYLENDAKLAGLAEAFEVTNLYKRILYVTVSTGIGLGLVVDGKIDYSVHDAGGRAIILEHQGKMMAWEEFASGKAIVAKTGKMAKDITDEKDWYIVARNIAVGLIDLIVALGPDCIIIGGGVGSHLDKFHQHLHEELEIYRSKMLVKMPQIIKAQHPEEAVINGGYLLCKQNDN